MSLHLNEISAHALCYLGDSVMEIRVRSLLVEMGISSSKNLNKQALLFVTAKSQAEAVEKIIPLLSDEESGAFHRGRNIGHASVPKSASVSEYRMATGLEALFGYLHLKGDNNRIDELFNIAFKDKIDSLSYNK